MSFKLAPFGRTFIIKHQLRKNHPICAKEYMKKEWTIHEFQAAKDRLIEERGTNYILPFKTDSIIIPELKKVGYSELDENNIEKHATRLISRIAK